MFLGWIIGMLMGCAIMFVGMYVKHRQIVEENDKIWAKVVENVYDNIPTSFQDAWEKGYDAFRNSEAAVKLQYEHFFGRPVHHKRDVA